LTAQETKPKVTLEERVSRGEASIGPTVPANQAQQVNSTLATGIRQVFPTTSDDQLQALGVNALPSVNDEPKKSVEAAATKESATPSNTNNEPKKSVEAAATNASAAPSNTNNETKEITGEDQEKIVAIILKQLTPLVEGLVANEIDRARKGITGNSNLNGSMPFPFMMSGNGPMLSTLVQGQTNNHVRMINRMNSSETKQNKALNYDILLDSIRKITWEEYQVVPQLFLRKC
jgi:hypothetical protein